ncbi:uncharacterized protein F4822DRAFT_78951 [Hypoxylon trugodes]|uniref:uncharacterized protein n=1 Tax=Hypoxylon trugodes TaxID=326681 RepID=UPI002193F8D2|nr:uncharacterized protein F4822DRAFT_78951 [Hypoxylon trugodes]KAI1383477.1 hypothetical protein F4822DRAFT_78951 [Hypoxylon trugodes]
MGMAMFVVRSNATTVMRMDVSHVMSYHYLPIITYYYLNRLSMNEWRNGLLIEYGCWLASSFVLTYPRMYVLSDTLNSISFNCLEC